MFTSLYRYHIFFVIRQMQHITITMMIQQVVIKPLSSLLKCLQIEHPIYVYINMHMPTYTFIHVALLISIYCFMSFLYIVQVVHQFLYFVHNHLCSNYVQKPRHQLRTFQKEMEMAENHFWFSRTKQTR